MDDELIKQLRAELERDRDELISTLADMDVDEGDPLKEMLRASLSDLERALGKMDEGNFGVCELCEGRVTEPRLRALPASRLCQRCEVMQTEAPV